MWSRKIAQFATPRNRSSRRSRPFSGRVALIFMGAVSQRWVFEDLAAGQGRQPCGRRRFSQRSMKIVTAQHNDYTGQEKYHPRLGISDQIPAKMSLYYP